jgi:hypothetical protein
MLTYYPISAQFIQTMLDNAVKQGLDLGTPIVSEVLRDIDPVFDRNNTGVIARRPVYISYEEDVPDVFGDEPMLWLNATTKQLLKSTNWQESPADPWETLTDQVSMFLEYKDLQVNKG